MKHIKIMKTISKAEEKRIKQATEFLNFQLRHKLKSFENEYLNHAAKWSVRKLELENLDYRKQITSIKESDNKRRLWEVDIKNLKYKIQKNVDILLLDAILKMGSFNDAKKNYDKKIDKIVELLISEGFSHLRFSIDDVYNNTEQIEFLISNDVKEVNARLIYAHGEVNAPHFRFITTVRQK